MFAHIVGLLGLAEPIPLHVVNFVIEVLRKRAHRWWGKTGLLPPGAVSSLVAFHSHVPPFL